MKTLSIQTNRWFAQSLSTMVVAVALLNLFIFGMVGMSIYTSYQAQLLQARDSAQNLSLVLTQSINAALDKVNLILYSSVKEIERQLRNGGMNKAALHAFLKRQHDDLPEADALRVTDANGRVLLGTGLHVDANRDLSERAYFKLLRDKPDLAYTISDPLVSSISGKHVIVFARRINHPDGSFAGVISAPITLDLIASYFSGLNLGSHGAVSLRKGFDDFAIIVRHPKKIYGTNTPAAGNPRHSSTFADLISKNVLNHVYEALTGVDKIYRTWSVRRLDKFNYYVGMGLAHDDLFAAWRKDMSQLLAFSFLFMAASILFARQHYRSWATQKKTFDMMQSMASMDGLTGIPNRRKFDEAFEEEWLRAKRDRQPISIIMLDLDNFKAYNDHHGHAQGDACLKRVARVIDESVKRAGDMVARFGGEEFVMLLPNTDLPGARIIAEKVRQDIEALHLPHPLSDTANWVTVSAGAYTMVPGDQDEAATLIENADRILYQAKHEGRNRVYASGTD